MQALDLATLPRKREPFTITVYPQTCLRCSANWNSLKPRPKRCRICKDPNYDKPRKFCRASKEKNQPFVSTQMDRDPKPFSEYRDYPISKLEEIERQDEKRRLEVIKAMSAIPDSEKRKYPCLNTFFTYPYPVYQKGAS